MTTATKITLGFGALIVLLIISNVAVILPLESVDDEIRAMTEVGRPRRAAAKAMEVGVLSYALAVRTYAQTNDPEHQKTAEDAIAEVETQYSEYVRLAETERHRILGDQFLPRWDAVKEKGRAITNGGMRYYGETEWRSLADSRNELLRFLREEILPESLSDYDARKQIAIGKVYAIERFVVIFFILCLIIAIVMSQAVGRAVVRSEKEVQSRREHLRATLSSIADAVVTTDTEGRITSLNVAAQHFTGLSEAEAIGKQLSSVFGFIDEATGTQVESPALKALREGSVISSDSVKLATRFGTQVPVEDHAAPILSPKGDVVGSVLVFRDITERKLYEQELIRIQEELDVRVKHRTHELAETHSELVKEMEGRAIAEQQRIGLLGRLVTSQEDERRRIARDLHDQLGQRLTALRLKLASLNAAAGDHEILTPKINRLQEIALRLDAEVSYLAWELRPSALDDLGFVAAVEAFVREWSRHFEISADFQAAKIPKRRFSPQMEIHLYRITQEALNNIAKHAGASHVSVILEKRGDRIILIIEDDGTGFVPGKRSVPDKSGRGLGLLGMRERATLIGGEVEIESAPGNGTTIYVRVPLADAVKTKSV
ncbi:MAG: PAS domain S-box protein [Pyrinomonadaceae bacterium]